MAKSGMQYLAKYMAEKNGVSQREASNFVRTFFDVLNDVLHDEKIVRIKGLGTFKVIDVKDRESVDVNTGERIVIEGRSKITFTPDNLMKELVNKPFSQFETVVLNDGVDFQDLETVFSEKLDEEMSDVDEETLVEVESIEEVEASEQDFGHEIAALAQPVDSESPDNVAQPVIEEEEISDVEVGKIDEPQEAPVVEKEDELVSEKEEKMMEEANVEERPRSSAWGWIWRAAAVVAVAVLSFIAGVQYERSVEKNQLTAEVAAVPENKKVDTQNPVEDRLGGKQDNNSQENANEKTAEEKALEVKQKAEEEARKQNESEELRKQQETKIQQEQKTEEAKKEQESPASQSSIKIAQQIVKTGAYNIIGTETSVTVRKGQTLKSISRMYLGDGMDCYVVVHNGVSEVSEGQILKIPKLQLKKFNKRK